MDVDPKPDSGTNEQVSAEAMSAEAMEIDESEVETFPSKPTPNWAQAIMNFLTDGSLPRSEAEARRVQ